MASVKRCGRLVASVSASELAQMGVCERLVVFEHQCGKLRTAEQQSAIKRGRRAHRRFYRERNGDSDRGKRGFAGHFRHQVRRFWRTWYCLLLRVTRWLHAAENRDEL